MSYLTVQPYHLSTSHQGSAGEAINSDCQLHNVALEGKGGFKLVNAEKLNLYQPDLVWAWCWKFRLIILLMTREHIEIAKLRGLVS